MGRLLLEACRPRRSPRCSYRTCRSGSVLGTRLPDGFRGGPQRVDSNVIDVGYSGVISADRIVDGRQLYGDGSRTDVERGEPTALSRTSCTCPSSRRCPGAAAGTTFRRLTARPSPSTCWRSALLLLGRRMRPGREGTALGVAWPTPGRPTPTRRSCSSRTRTTRSWPWPASARCSPRPWRATGVRGRERARARARRGLEVRDGRAAPLFARRSPLVFAGVFRPGDAWSLALRARRPGELYDRTVGYQASRPSPFSVWGQLESSAKPQDGRGRRSALALSAVPLAGRAFARPRRRARRSFSWSSWPPALVLPGRGPPCRSSSWPCSPRTGGRFLSRAWPASRSRSGGWCSREARSIVAVALLITGWALTLWVAPE